MERFGRGKKMAKKKKDFGDYLKELRLEARIGLREFARLIDMKPSNFSNIERGKVAPPATKKTLDVICDTLGLGKSSEERIRLIDLAAADSKRIPVDIAQSVKEFKGIPVLVRTIANKQLSEKKLRELTKYIQENY